MHASSRVPCLAAVLFGVLLLGASPRVQGQRVVATVDSTASVIDYTGSATMHNWTGTSRDVAGTLTLDLDAPDSSRVALRAPVASFDSGNEARDENMRDVTEAETFPLVRFEATDIRPREWESSGGIHSGRWLVTGALTFHGQTHPVEASVDVRVTRDSVRARARFPVSLTRFDVERPGIVWGIAPIGDTIRIDARVVGAIQERRASAAHLRVPPHGETAPGPSRTYTMGAVARRPTLSLSVPDSDRPVPAESD